MEKKGMLWRRIGRRFLAAALAGSLCLGMTVNADAAKKKDKNSQAPSNAVAGGMIYSNVYGEILVTEEEGVVMNYTFFNTDWPAVQELLKALDSGKKIDLDKLLTASSTSIKSITKNDGSSINMNIENAGAAASGVRGTYDSGSVYGSNLGNTELEQLKGAVSAFLVNTNVAGLSDVQKVRMAHDYLVLNCAPTSPGGKNHADNAWGALVYREANSKGYARAMKAMCDAMGVASYVISANSSSVKKDYMWNVVLVNGEWYIVDVFCDDSMSGYPTYLISDNTYITYGMRWDKGNNIPVCKKNYGAK